MRHKKILFLSALDFKDKSIQVIRKTPEAYANSGWEVDYIVARDNCPKGNYFYESEINPLSINVIRFYWPINKLRTKTSRYFNLFISKIASFIVILKLFVYAFFRLKKYDYDVVYGYEIHGVLAMSLLRFVNVGSFKTVSRFQGTFLNEMLENKQVFRLCFNIDLIMAMRVKSDLLIMTNDGTMGDKALKKICNRNSGNSQFWVNGVDKFIVRRDALETLRRKYGINDNELILVSVSRLVNWKRVDRCVRIVSELKQLGCTKFKYLIVGEGDKREELQALVEKLNIKENIIFVGSVPNCDVKNYIAISTFFMSMYDSSNVGNPLLEAIRLKRPVITLDNGDTGSWIKHNENGLIYSVNGLDFVLCAKDILEAYKDIEIYRRLLDGIQITYNEKLWTWCERMNAEINMLNSII